MRHVFVLVALVALPASSMARGGGPHVVAESARLVPANPVPPLTLRLLGVSVAVDGDTAIVGSHLIGPFAGQDYGEAHVFRRDRTGSWGEVVHLLDAGSGPTLFGDGVSISGDTAVVNATYGQTITIFERDQGGADRWEEVRKILPTLGDFGYVTSVALDGDILVTGGASSIHERDRGGPDSWGQVRTFPPGNAAVSGDTVVTVTSPVFEPVPTGRVHERNAGGPDQWGEVALLVAEGVQADDGYGHSVAIDGDLIVVGAPDDDEAGADAGAAYVFARERGGPAGWGQVAKLTATGAAAGDRFGTSVAIDGDTVVVGAYDGGLPPYGDLGTRGSAHVFVRHRGGVDAWQEVERLEPLGGTPGSFGHTVSIDGGTALVGAPGTGPAYVFGVATDSHPSFCDASDGSLRACPCGNPGSPDTGCDLPQGTGGVGLHVLAQTSGPNAATLQGVGFPPASAPIALLKRSDALDPASPVVFGDGLRCVAAHPLVRLGVATASGGVSTHVIGHGAMGGAGTFYYQLWYRSSPGSFCDPLVGFNQSNGRTLTW